MCVSGTFIPINIPARYVNKGRQLCSKFIVNQDEYRRNKTIEKAGSLLADSAANAMEHACNPPI